MKTDRSDILTWLRNSEDYVSGQQLCERFGVSRTAVWKVINQLKEEGYTIESVSRKGYRLVESPADVYSESEIISRLQTKWAGRTLHFFESTGSTNPDAKRFAEEGAPHGTTVVADRQTAGRGRRGRSWESPAGKSIYFTIVVRPEFEPDKASMITLVVALAVAEAVREETGLSTGIKWPNDVVVNGKKICGILTEMSMTPEMNEIQFLVAGVGVNVNQDSEEDFTPELRGRATSLKMESGRPIDRAALLARILHHFEEDYDLFEKRLDLSDLQERYEALLLGKDNRVRVLDPAGEYTGISRGINGMGELIVEKEDGETVLVYAGEVSVRGLYGYT
ncbi:MAG: biotin--[acetyl-CoA-carboxylase] ligase [Lachnospiraceae bacterium]|nr:biotin--[acetyl-CoA-carboxylase] ligase [Lachnospiraceae bacterium]